MAPFSRLEINFCRLLDRCESMASQRKSNDWRFETYVQALEEMLTELKKLNICQPSKDTLVDYTKKVEFLRGLIDIDKLASPSDKLMAQQLLSPGSISSASDNKTKELHLQNKAKVMEEMREELLGMKGGDKMSGEKSNLRQRTGSKQSNSDDFDAVLRYHNSMQEKIAEEMLSLAQNLKQNALLAGNIVKKDTEVVQKSVHQTEHNFGRLEVEKGRLEEHIKFSCNWWLWLMLGLVCVVFVMMVTFMRLFPKRYAVT